MARRPDYLSQVQYREGLKLAPLKRAISRIESRGITSFSRQELEKLAMPILREARVRMKELERENLTDSPAYVYAKKHDLDFKTLEDNRSKMLTQVKGAMDFIRAKSSVVPEAQKYSDWVSEHLGVETTTEERELIWTIVHEAERLLPGRFINFNYDETIKKVAILTKHYDYDGARVVEELKKLVAGEATFATEVIMSDTMDDDGREELPLWPGNSSSGW